MGHTQHVEAKIVELNFMECLQCGSHIFPRKCVRRLLVILVNSSLGVKNHILNMHVLGL